jgi:DNA-directed RNA polymerase subunit RPC12/RpoP
MALIKCPECGKEVSNTTYRCPHCGYMVKVPERTIVGKIFEFVFEAFNFIMILIFLSMFFGLIGSEDGAGIAGLAGTVVLFVVWIVVGLPLGLMYYITRPKISN